MKQIYDYNYVKEKLRNKNLFLLTDEKDYVNSDTLITVTNGIYKAQVQAYNYICENNSKNEPKWFYKRNPYIIENINIRLQNEKNGNFACISEPSEYIKRESLLQFECTRCNTYISKSYINAFRHDENNSHKGLMCPNCDGALESIHALVLKQLFLHYYPDTVLEDKSCINPNTNKIMATDIVNHRLKIAIEIQGQWHKYENQKERDIIKKNFWLNKGYTFYDYSIEGISVLDYAKLFFKDITEIPDWVDMNFSNKLNLIEIQKLLNTGFKVNEISEKLNVNIHRIYDALGENKLYYPVSYIKSTQVPIVQLTMNREYIADYINYREAERQNNITKGLIASAIYYKSYYTSGYYWIPKDLYDSNSYIIPQNRLEKFYVPIGYVDDANEIIEKYENCYVAASKHNTIASKIYEIASGKKKTYRGKRFKFLT